MFICGLYGSMNAENTLYQSICQPAENATWCRGHQQPKMRAQIQLKSQGLTIGCRVLSEDSDLDCQY